MVDSRVFMDQNGSACAALSVAAVLEPLSLRLRDRGELSDCKPTICPAGLPFGRSHRDYFRAFVDSVPVMQLRLIAPDPGRSPTAGSRAQMVYPGGRFSYTFLPVPSTYHHEQAEESSFHPAKLPSPFRAFRSRREGWMRVGIWWMVSVCWNKKGETRTVGSGQALHSGCKQ
jgi:hypothetical protein